MAFKRAFLPSVEPEANELTAAMAGIGIAFAVKRSVEANIENTLLFASVEGMERDDLRVLSVLVTWFFTHVSWVNADRLTKLAKQHSSVRVRAFWTALAQAVAAKHKRFVPLAKVHRGDRVDVLRVGMEFQLKRNGEDERFAATALRVPANVLRDRASDVLTPQQLAKRHGAYRWRVIIGPTYRADMWAALEQDSTLSAAELARRTHGSFSTAWHARRDFSIAVRSER